MTLASPRTAALGARPARLTVAVDTAAEGKKPTATAIGVGGNARTFQSSNGKAARIASHVVATRWVTSVWAGWSLLDRFGQPLQPKLISSGLPESLEQEGDQSNLYT